MNNEIVHRGPDDAGIFIEFKNECAVAMGMRRLSIIDLQNGNQPIVSSDGNLILVFNGEIYNYLSLKKKLKMNHKVEFKTTSDSEVILKMYEIYGQDSFDQLDGMYAFSIYDKIKNKIFIARDFFGEKPLFYSKKNNEIVWCSELKSILNVFEGPNEIDKYALSLYFQLTYIPAPFTIYKDIKKLPPNHYLEVDLTTFDITENIISKPKPVKKIKKNLLR